MRRNSVRAAAVPALVLALALVLVLAGSPVCRAQTIPGGAYFGQEPPGFAARVFAPGIISLSNRYEAGVAFSPNLDECVFGVTNAPWSAFNLWYTRMESDSTWIDPIPAPFQGNGDGLCPAYSADGNTIYFASSRPAYPPTRMWRVSRQGEGWGVPALLPPPIDSGANEWGGSLTADGTLYFGSQRAGGFGGIDLYRSWPAEGGWSEPENLGSPVNTPQLEGDVYVARDGSYMIFESQRPGGFGQSDLYLSRNENGVWSTPTNLGPAVNTAKIESGPFISPDGKYFFFTRRAASVTLEQSELWWIDAGAVLDPADTGDPDPGLESGGRILLHSDPNPFGAATKITYTTPTAGFVALKIFDPRGREVQSLVNAPRERGTYAVSFERPPEDVPSGVYFCRLQVDGRRLETTRMVALR